MVERSIESPLSHIYNFNSIELNFKHLLGRGPDNFDETIATLQKQLAELSPVAAIGTAYLSDWQSNNPAESVATRLDTQAAQIAKLQVQIADARRYAAIGDARVNKWRSRTFNS
jgi:hypothetical protein